MDDYGFLLDAPPEPSARIQIAKLGSFKRQALRVLPDHRRRGRRLAAFTLPTGFQPTTAKTLPAYCASGGRALFIATSGVVTLGASGNAPPWSLDGLSFPLDI